MNKEFPTLLAQIRDELSVVEQAVASGGDAKMATKTLHSWCGVWQRRCHEILAPPTPLTDQQQDTARRAWKEFTNDQRVVDFCESKKLTLAKGRLWHWCSDQRPGHLEGFEKNDGSPTVCGVCRISNGVDVWIERTDGGGMFMGHLQWFKVDKKSKGGTAGGSNRSLGAPNKKTREAQELKAKILAQLTLA